MAVASAYDRPMAGSRSRFIVLAVAVLAVALGLRLFGLTTHSLWFDEGYSIGLAGQETFSAFITELRDGGPGQITQPLYFFTLFFWQKIAGDSDMSLRLLSALTGFGAVVALFFTARRAFGDKHALWVSAFAATSSFAVYYSQEVRPYAQMLLLTALLLWAYTETTLTPRLKARHLIALMLATVLMMLGSVISVFVLAAFALSDLLIWRRVGRWFITWLPAGAAGAVVMVAYWLVWPPTSTVLGPPNPVFNLAYVPFGLLVGQTFGPPLDTLRGADAPQVVFALWPRLALLAVVALGILWRLRHLAIGSDRLEIGLTQQRMAQTFALMLVLSYVAGAALMFGMDFNWLPRRAAYMLPLIALLLPLAMQAKGWRLVGTASVVGLIALNVFSLWIYFNDPAHRRDEYRETAAYIAETASPENVAIVAWGQWEIFEHYGGTDIIDGDKVVRSDDFVGDMQALAGDRGVIRLIVNREWNFDKNFARKNQTTMVETMAQAYELVDLKEFVAMKIYTFRRKSRT